MTETCTAVIWWAIWGYLYLQVAMSVATVLQPPHPVKWTKSADWQQHDEGECSIVLTASNDRVCLTFQKVLHSTTVHRTNYLCAYGCNLLISKQEQQLCSVCCEIVHSCVGSFDSMSEVQCSKNL